MHSSDAAGFGDCRQHNKKGHHFIWKASLSGMLRRRGVQSVVLAQHLKMCTLVVAVIPARKMSRSVQ